MNQKNGHFVVIWEFWVRTGAEPQFERAYGKEGAWVRLFAADPEYMGTQLLRDGEKPGRYVTQDAWSSETAYDSFRQQHAAEYQAIDRECEGLTEREIEVGRFESLPD